MDTELSLKHLSVPKRDKKKGGGVVVVASSRDIKHI